MRLLIDGFSYCKVGDESMSVIQFCTTSKGDLPYLYYVFRKTEPLGAEFMMVACYVKVSLVFLDIQRGKEEMKSSWYYLELGSTYACTKKFMEKTKGLGQRDLRGSTRDFSLLDSLLLSKKAAKEAVYIGVYFIGIVTTNNKELARLLYSD